MLMKVVHDKPWRDSYGNWYSGYWLVYAGNVLVDYKRTPKEAKESARKWFRLCEGFDEEGGQ